MTIRRLEKNVRAADILVLSRRMDAREHLIDLLADCIERLPCGVLQRSILEEFVQDFARFVQRFLFASRFPEGELPILNLGRQVPLLGRDLRIAA